MALALAGCAHYHPGISHIDTGSNYADGVDGLFDVKLHATVPENEYSFGDESWKAIFGDTRLYTGISRGNRSATRGEIRGRLLDAVAVTGAYLGYRYAAIYDVMETDEVFHPRQSARMVPVETAGVSIEVNSVAEYDVSERYKVDFEVPAMTCRVMFFSGDTQIKIIRKVFNPTIYEVKDIFAKVTDKTIWG